MTSSFLPGYANITNNARYSSARNKYSKGFCPNLIHAVQKCFIARNIAKLIRMVRVFDEIRVRGRGADEMTDSLCKKDSLRASPSTTRCLVVLGKSLIVAVFFFVAII